MKLITLQFTLLVQLVSSHSRADGLKSADLILRKALTSVLERYESAQGLEPTWVLPGHGGYILKGYADVTGDGKTELLIASTMDIHRVSLTWTVYEEMPDGTLQAYPEPVRGWVDGCAGARDAHGCLVLFEYDRDMRDLTAIKLKELKMDKLVFTAAEYGDTGISPNPLANEYGDLHNKRPRINFNTQAIRLSDYVAGNTTWLSLEGIEGRYPSGGYFVSEQDEVEMKARKDFTPKVALQMLKKLEQQTTPGGKDTAAAGNPLNTPNADRVQPGGGKSGSDTATPWWWLWAGLALLVSGVVVFLRRKPPAV